MPTAAVAAAATRSAAAAPDEHGGPKAMRLIAFVLSTIRGLATRAELETYVGSTFLSSGYRSANVGPACASSPPLPRAGRSRVGLLRIDRELVAIGLLGGVLSGLLGVGGGIVMVPLLVLWAHYGQRDAHAASLGAIIPISIAGIVTYGIAGEVKVGPAIALATGSIFGAQLGAGMLARLDERVLKSVFGALSRRCCRADGRSR